MKMMQGEFCLACSKRSRTREAPTPTNISTKSEPEIEKKGTRASPAPAGGRGAQKHALRDPRTQGLEFLRVLEELLDLVELLDGLVHAGDVAEGDLGSVDRHPLPPALAKVHHARPPALHLVHQEDPEGEEEEEGQDVGEQREQ